MRQNGKRMRQIGGSARVGVTLDVIRSSAFLRVAD
jgi:hypothetical protein